MRHHTKKRNFAFLFCKGVKAVQIVLMHISVAFHQAAILSMVDHVGPDTPSPVRRSADYLVEVQQRNSVSPKCTYMVHGWAPEESKWRSSHLQSTMEVVDRPRNRCAISLFLQVEEQKQRAVNNALRASEDGKTTVLLEYGPYMN
jgi:hypothetical protein